MKSWIIQTKSDQQLAAVVHVTVYNVVLLHMAAIIVLHVLALVYI